MAGGASCREEISYGFAEAVVFDLGKVKAGVDYERAARAWLPKDDRSLRR